jgi:hypothetical protein
VERLFSHGRLAVTHTRSRLSAQTTRAIICLVAWSLLNLLKTEDVMLVAALGEVVGNEYAMEDGWDSIML